MRKTLVATGLIAVLAAGWWWAGMPGLPNAANGADGALPRLRTAQADRGAITAVVAATGTVNPVTLVQVGSQLSGQIRELFADFNTRVAADQPIARLDTATIEARRAAAEADVHAAAAQVAVARAQAERARADEAQSAAQIEAARAAVLGVEASVRDAEGEAARTAELRARGVGAERDALRAAFAAERSRAAVAQARADLLRAEAAAMSAAAAARTALAQVDAADAAREQKDAILRQVEVDLRNATIRSPIDGVVVSRNIDIGQTVAASFQAPVLFQIAASLEEMEVHATVDEADIGRVRQGQDVTFTVAAFPSETLRGRVKDIRLAATTVQNVVTYTVVIAAPNAAGRLLPGMTATLRIITEERPQALRVPNAALRWRPPGAAAGGAGGGEQAAPGQAQLDQALAALGDLTAAQRAEIEAARAEMRQRMAALPQDADARRQQAQAARQRLVSRLNAVLTPDQRAQLAAMRGGARASGQPGTVWVQDGAGAPRAVPVRTGITDGSVTEILAGALEPGATVVIGQERAGAAAAPAAARRLF
ncbi:efflux RND transporter periplasmic adaptor subunit [Roseomonas sp. PWR1]|uniref:Efflux RND transporter periplasmic adaptor subunit n=1 Tax=Roseomonas nitratireducens TaxID=2820810 RepID=A0ABS4AMU9_9PROT|nr:efflux RND transporter periplasmic adaptor subunit [Neoroseomonas nitratireducens]MBP0462677.1 efflux RND transporter periplasmic adaptor subunit [Neoroseomonas nitratireducens]